MTSAPDDQDDINGYGYVDIMNKTALNIVGKWAFFSDKHTMYFTD